MEKSKELSIDLKRCIIDLNKSGNSLGAISKHIQVLRSADADRNVGQDGQEYKTTMN